MHIWMVQGNFDHLIISRLQLKTAGSGSGLRGCRIAGILAMRISEAEREVTNAELVIEIELQICHPTEDADPEMIQNETFDLVGSGVDSETERLIILDMENMKRAMPPGVTYACCIYRVPPTMREVNEASYTPRVVSIGPFHHGRDEYESMENQKMRYLNDFVERTQKSLKDIVNIAHSWEVRARRCYSQSVEPSSAKFVLMLLKDGVFIVEHMLRIRRKVTITHEDFLVMKPWLSTDVGHDLILLENQLPFFVIHGLYALLPPDQSGTLPSTSTTLENLINLIRECFSNYYDPKTTISSARPKHLLDLIYYFQIPKEPPKWDEKNSGTDEVKLPKYSATRLHQAGVKFQVSESKCLLDIKFRKEDGALEMPLIRIEDSSESFLRNLVAFEQCHFPHCELYMAYYILLLDKLVNTCGDVDVLEKDGVIENLLGDNETLSTTINKLGAHITLWKGSYYFASICNDLDAYCSVPRHEWMATCRREYCSTPWRILSIIAATILLILTMIQTINSIVAFFV
uniref:Uncharacterized protein n=1 Tax=Kalanchoe fedtschenkoi TaxID=63787 RepID=A0A7N0RIX4_KALFE